MRKSLKEAAVSLVLYQSEVSDCYFRDSSMVAMNSKLGVILLTCQ